MNIHQKKLAVVQSIWTIGHKYARAVRSLYEQGRLGLVDTKYHSMHFGRDYDFSDEKSTSTYDKCVEAQVLVHEGKELLRLEIWDGNILDGKPIKHRSTFSFEGEWWAIQNLVDVLNSKFDTYCFELLMRREDDERAKKARDIGLELIAKVPGPLTEVEQ